MPFHPDFEPGQPVIDDLGAQAKAIIARWTRGAAVAARGADYDEAYGGASEYVDVREGEIQDAGLDLGALRREGLRRLREANSAWHDLEECHLQALIAASLKFGSLCSGRWRTNRRRGNTIDVMVELHGQVLLVADEVGALLADGRAIGAQARWRTLFELVVCMQFLSTASDLAARIYKASVIAERWRHIDRYETYLKHQASSWLNVDSELEWVEQARDKWGAAYEKANRRYGKALRSSYGWAQADLGSKRVTFADLVQVTVGVGDPRWLEYHVATEHVHALRASSVRTMGRQWNGIGPTFSLHPQAPQRIYVSLARTLADANDVLARTLYAVTPDKPVIVYFAEVCQMMALDVQTEAFRGGAEVSPQFLDRAFGLV